MSDPIGIRGIGPPPEVPTTGAGAGAGKAEGSGFADSLEQAIRQVDELQKESEVAQAAYARGEQVDLHDVLIKIEEADMAFRTMMEVRNKLIDAYREVMRMT